MTSRFDENREQHIYGSDHATSRPLPVVGSTEGQRAATARAAQLAVEILGRSAVNVRGEDALELANLVLDFFGDSTVERADEDQP